jgi:hypothetical protein
LRKIETERKEIERQAYEQAREDAAIKARNHVSGLFAHRNAIIARNQMLAQRHAAAERRMAAQEKLGPRRKMF